MTTKTAPRLPDVNNDVLGMDASQTLGALMAEHAGERKAAAAKMRGHPLGGPAPGHRWRPRRPGSGDRRSATTLGDDRGVRGRAAAGLAGRIHDRGVRGL